MLILGIETSCDETAAAVIKDGTVILSNVIASSQAMHAKFGGIIPEQAAREQVKSIIPVIQEATKDVHPDEIGAIAVTIGPGLIGSLLVGVETAKTLAFTWKKPIIPVNHLLGHIYANWLNPENGIPVFPTLALLVSGGHTELILLKDHGKFELIGTTRDDAAGECLDKCARVLNLGYPGGPAIEKAAVKSETVPLPRPLIHEKNFEFSFSGLKTAVLNRKDEDPKGLAFELQESVVDVLVSKTLKAAQKYDIKSIVVAGGVAANRKLREKLPQAKFPPINLCTDNAAYIASAAFFNFKPVAWQEIEAVPDLNF